MPSAEFSGRPAGAAAGGSQLRIPARVDAPTSWLCRDMGRGRAATAAEGPRAKRPARSAPITASWSSSWFTARSPTDCPPPGADARSRSTKRQECRLGGNSAALSYADLERTCSQRRDCLAGHEGLELRNVAANYPFERAHRFAGTQPNSGDRDYSRLSCAAGEMPLGPRVAGIFSKRLMRDVWPSSGIAVRHAPAANDLPPHGLVPPSRREALDGIGEKRIPYPRPN
jgi:hypothetical protein